MKLEDYIKKNRSKFNTELPSDVLWGKIEKEIRSRPGRRISLFSVLAIAACSSLVLMVSVYWAYQTGKNDGADFAREKIEIKNYYEKKLDNQYSKLASLNLQSDVKLDLDSLDPGLLKQQPKNELEKEAQLRAIIQNFETRISIIEKVLERAPSNSNKTKLERNEKSI